MKDYFAWVEDREQAFEFGERKAALHFCSERKLSGVHIVQRGDDSTHDVVVQTVA